MRVSPWSAAEEALILLDACDRAWSVLSKACERTLIFDGRSGGKAAAAWSSGEGRREEVEGVESSVADRDGSRALGISSDSTRPPSLDFSSVMRADLSRRVWSDTSSVRAADERGIIFSKWTRTARRRHRHIMRWRWTP